MPSTEIVLFIIVALLAGGLTMGGVTLVYFFDKWRPDVAKSPDAEPAEARRSVFDQAA